LCPSTRFSTHVVIDATPMEKAFKNATRSLRPMALTLNAQDISRSALAPVFAEF
jgi:hypothetical protein